MDDATSTDTGRAGKAGRVSGPKSGISLRNEAPPLEVCGAVYRTKGGGAGGGSYFQRLKESEKGSRDDAGAEAWLEELLLFSSPTL